MFLALTGLFVDRKVVLYTDQTTKDYFNENLFFWQNWANFGEILDNFDQILVIFYLSLNDLFQTYLCVWQSISHKVNKKSKKTLFWHWNPINCINQGNCDNFTLFFRCITMLPIKITFLDSVNSERRETNLILPFLIWCSIKMVTKNWWRK